MTDNHDLHLLAELSASIDNAQQAFQRAADEAFSRQAGAIERPRRVMARLPAPCDCGTGFNVAHSKWARWQSWRGGQVDQAATVQERHQSQPGPGDGGKKCGKKRGKKRNRQPARPRATFNVQRSTFNVVRSPERTFG